MRVGITYTGLLDENIPPLIVLQTRTIRDGDPMLITEIVSKTADSFTFLYGEEVCAYQDVPTAGQKIMDALQETIQQHLIEIRDAAIWSYEPAGDKLTLRAGFPVRKGTQAIAPFVVKTEPEWKCLSATYKGSMESITKAWGELFGLVKERGLDRTPESREIYHTWVDYDSAENVTELQVRLK
jgi:effector-binding domain-containing protein